MHAVEIPDFTQTGNSQFPCSVLFKIVSENLQYKKLCCRWIPSHIHATGTATVMVTGTLGGVLSVGSVPYLSDCNGYWDIGWRSVGGFCPISIQLVYFSRILSPEVPFPLPSSG
ncbi:hypothetical protein AVEN_98449-1 [Araneus ventricosus]|uniref:Uncharacterized protein n=1 Tax=Araneus ventricosus TaxID=182803 RepID=A0A4Y2LB98_ARAVE|nr:hypothetical protein AVEN_98449-1 [Araneus ventricosus]